MYFVESPIVREDDAQLMQKERTPDAQRNVITEC